MLARLGVPVRMHYRNRLPLRGFDEMLRTAAAAALQAAGVELHPGVMPTRIAPAPGDGGWLLLFGEERVAQVPWVLNATGRRPWTEGLGLETLGVAPSARGAVEVDAGLRTAAPGLYAIGDVTARPALAPVAIADDRALADTLFGGQPRQVDLSRVPSAVFMPPLLACVGPSEAEAAAAGRARIYETDFRPMRQAFVGGRERTHMKLLVDDASERVLAVHMAGADAPEIVQSKIQEESMHYEMLKHTGELPIIGVNTFRKPKGEAVPEHIELARSSDEEKQSQLQRLAAFHARHAAEAPAMLQRLQQAVLADEIVFAVLMDAVRVCSLGQITNALFEVGGQYRRSM